jgi:outer membrane receptor protein involved in Fe transport
MKKYSFELIAIIFCAFCIQASAQKTNTVNGVVIDSTNQKGISYSNVAILKQVDSSLVKGTTCDENGVYKFDKIPLDSIIIRYSCIGYQTKYLPVILVKNSTDFSKTMLSPITQTLETVSITASKPLYSFEADKKVYNVSEDIAMQGGVAADALQNAPGVWVDMEGNITLRGVSGVEIWINGKPSKLKEEGLKSYLQQLPANALEKIEVMTNPSAKYGASGTGGIINIVTKSKIKKNFLFSFGLNTSTRPEFSPWLSYVWSNSKWNINTYLSRSQSDYKYKNSSNGIVKNGVDTTYTFNTLSESSSTNSWTYGHIGVEYQINPKSSVEVYFGGGVSDGTNTTYSLSNRYMTQENMLYQITTNNYGKSNGGNWNGGATYSYKFNEEGHYLMLDLSGGSWHSRWNSDNEELYTLQTEKNRKSKRENFNKSGWNNLGLYYENPINDNKKIEAGFGLSYSPQETDNPVDTMNFATNEWIRANRYYNKNHGSDIETNGYLTFSNKLWFFKYKLGLRSESKQYRFTSDAVKTDVNRDFFNLYPSVYLSYQTKNQHNFSLNYARRVQYPDYQLDPFVNYRNEDMLYGGNPNLKEAFTNSFEMGWSKYFKSGGSINLTLYNRSTNNTISSFVEVRQDSVLQRTTLFSSYTNSGKDVFSGGEFTLTLRPKKYLNIMLNSNLYNKIIEADLGMYKINKNDFTYDGRATIMLTIKKLYTFQVVAIYKSSNPSIQGSTDPTYFINTTLKADLFKRKLSVRFSVQDVFNWQQEYRKTNTPMLISSNTSKSTTQYFSLGITFRFGKIELESKAKTGGGQPQGGGTQM